MAALSPFNDPSGDIILRSSDNVSFLVLKKILSMASPVFQRKFHDRQHADSSRIEIGPVADVEEDSATIDRILRYCYPGEDPKIERLDDLKKVLTTVDKYELAGVSARLEGRYVALMETGAKPVEAFVLACRYKWSTVARLAATEALYFSMDQLFEQAASVDRKCRAACQHLCKNPDLVTGQRGLFHVSQHYCNAKIIDNCKWPMWWINHMERLGVAFVNGPVLPALATMPELDLTLKEISASRDVCHECMSVEIIGSILKFMAAFEAKVNSTPLDPIRHARLRIFNK